MIVKYLKKCQNAPKDISLTWVPILTKARDEVGELNMQRVRPKVGRRSTKERATDLLRRRREELEKTARLRRDTLTADKPIVLSVGTVS